MFYRYRIAVVALILLFALTGCARYTRDIFWENKIKPTPYAAPEHIVNPEIWQDDEITYAWLGHATVLLDIYGTKIITDPAILSRIGPPEVFDNLFGIKRLIRLPMDAESFSDIRLVLVSHPHFDHMDLASLETLSENNDFDLIVPALTKDLLVSSSVLVKDSIFELDWFDRAPSGRTYDEFTVTAFRVEHYGFADWGDRDNPRGFNGYLLQVHKNKRTIAFFGDTSYLRYRDEWGNLLPQPKSIDWRDKFPQDVIREGIDLCIIPVGDAYYYWNHIGPEKALQLADELNCKHLLPIHYSTFILTPPEKMPVSTKDQLLDVLNETGRMDLVKCTNLLAEQVFPEPGVSCVLP